MDPQAGAVLAVVTDFVGEPARDLALEMDFLDRAAGGEAILLMYSWSKPTVVVGYGQPVDDVDLDWCRRRGVGVFRRTTGGTGVVHRRDLGVSLFLPIDHAWARKIVGLYEHFLDALEPALNRWGGGVVRIRNPKSGTSDRSPICFEDRLAETLLVGDRKVVGCAQTRRARSVMVHAAVSLDLAADLYAGAFGVSEDRIRRGLGNAASGGRPHDVGREIRRVLEAHLGLEGRSPALVQPSSRSSDLYRTPKWFLGE